MAGTRSIIHLLRRVAAGGLACLPVAALVVAGLLLRPVLGSVMATHWSGDASTPDEVSDTWASFWIFTSITLALTIAAVAMVVASERFRPARLWALIASLTGGLLATAWLAAAWATVDAATPAQASLGGRVLLLVAGVAVAAAVFALTPTGASRAGTAEKAPAALELAPGERVAWSARISSPLFVVIAVALVILSALFAVVGSTSGMGGMFVGVAAFGIAAVSVLALTPARLTIDSRGVRLTSVILGVPLIRVGLENIRNVTTDTIEPLQWGGWGYRISGNGRAYVTRRGPGIVIHRRNASPIAITVTQSEQAAATANALVKPAEVSL